MPTYSYRCTSCGDEFDVRQSFSDEALKVCEKCGGDLRKLFNSVGIVFKGSGFYHNDAKSASASLQAKTTPKQESSENSSAATSTSQASSSSSDSAASTSSTSATK